MSFEYESKDLDKKFKRKNSRKRSTNVSCKHTSGTERIRPVSKRSKKSAEKMISAGEDHRMSCDASNDNENVESSSIYINSLNIPGPHSTIETSTSSANNMPLESALLTFENLDNDNDSLKSQELQIIASESMDLAAGPFNNFDDLDPMVEDSEIGNKNKLHEVSLPTMEQCSSFSTNMNDNFYNDSGLSLTTNFEEPLYIEPSEINGCFPDGESLITYSTMEEVPMNKFQVPLRGAHFSVILWSLSPDTGFKAQNHLKMV